MVEVDHRFNVDLRPFSSGDSSFSCTSISGKQRKQLNETKLQMRAVTEIVQRLIEAERKNETVDLNKMKMAISRKYCTERQPKLVDIIAAVPQQYKKTLVPKLKAKPVRYVNMFNVRFFFLKK